MQPLALLESLQFLTSTQRTLGGSGAGTDPQHLELPGGSPFSLCPAASASDLLKIDSVELTPQPLRMCVAPHTVSVRVSLSLQVTDEL